MRLDYRLTTVLDRSWRKNLAVVSQKRCEKGNSTERAFSHRNHKDYLCTDNLYTIHQCQLSHTSVSYIHNSA